MKNLIATMFFVAITITTNGQTIKTYSGAYGNGKITYKYFENDLYERIYHGPYTYTGESYITGIGDGNVIVNGSFTDNFQNGSWNYSFQEKSNKVKVNIKGQYKDGLMEGNWTKTISDLINKKTTQSIIVNYKNGKLFGDFFFYQNKDTIKGQFNENNRYDGKWTVKYQNDNSEPCEIVCNFEDGVIKFAFNRNLATGKIILRETEIDNAKFYEKFFCSYCGGRNNPIGYLYFVTARLSKNDISNGYFYSYGETDSNSATDRYGLKDIEYETLKNF